MKIKYMPVSWNPYAAHNFPDGTLPDTEIEVVNENTLVEDGNTFTIPEGDGQWTDVSKETEGALLEARRTSGEVFVAIRRFYTGARPSWDTGDYHDVNPGDSV